MSSRPLKSLGTGALQELTLTEEEYLAYRAGVHLGTMTTTSAAALCLDDTKTAIGSYTDSYYSGSSGSVNSQTYDLGTLVMEVESGSANGSLSAAAPRISPDGAANFGPVPSTVQVGDTLTFVVQTDYNILTGGIPELISQYITTTVDGVTGGSVSLSNVTSPTANSTTTTSAVWDSTQFSAPSSGTLQSTFTMVVEGEGELNIIFNVLVSKDGLTPDSASDSWNMGTEISTIQVNAGSPGLIEVNGDPSLYTDTDALGNVEVGTVINVTLGGGATPTPFWNQALSTNQSAYTVTSTLGGDIGYEYTVEVTGTGPCELYFNNGPLTGGDPVQYYTLTFTGVAASGGGYTLNSDVISLYQNLTTVASQRNEANWRGLLQWDKTQNPPGLKEMNDTELDVLVERLVKKIMRDEFPGVFRLASSSPGADWTVFLSNVFTDTRNDGHSQNYSIYIKQSGTVPTKRKAMTVERSSGSVGTFAGIKEGSDAVLSTTLGERAKEVIKSTGIGTYQLRSSAQGSPTEPGIWVSRGIAVDTRNQTTYTSDVEQYLADYQLDYIAEYQGETNPTLNFTSQFEDNVIYEGDFILDILYEGDFILDIVYEGDFVLNILYEGDFIADFILDIIYEGDFIGDFILDTIYEGDFIGDFILNIQYQDETNPTIQFQDETNPTTNPVIQYQDETNPTTNPTIVFEGNFIDNVQFEENVLYEGDFILDILYEGDFILNIQYQEETNPTTNPVIQFQDETNPTTNPTIVYEGDTNPTINYVGDFQDETNPTTNPTIQYQDETNPVIQFQDEVDNTTNPTIQFQDETNPTTNPTIQYQDETNPTIVYEGNVDYILDVDYIADYIYVSETNFTEPYLDEPTPSAPYIDDVDYIGNFVGDVDYIGDANYVEPYIDNVDYIGDFIGNVGYTQQTNPTIQYQDNVDYIGDFILDITYIAEPTPTANYQDNVDYIGDFVRDLQYFGETNPTINYQDNVDYIGDFIRDLQYFGETNPTANYQDNPDYIGDFIRDLQYFAEPNATANYQYNLDYIGDFVYTIDYIGDGAQEVPYIGDFIDNVQYFAEPTPTINYQDNVDYIGDFIGNVGYTAEPNATINYQDNVDYIGNSANPIGYTAEPNVTINYIGGPKQTTPYVGDFIDNVQYFAEPTTPTPYIDNVDYIGDFIGNVQYFAEPNATINYQDNVDYIGNFVGNVGYTAEPNVTINYIGTVKTATPYIGDLNTTANYQYNFDYIGDFIGNVNYVGNTNPTINYQDNVDYIGDFIGNVGYTQQTNPTAPYVDNVNYIGDFILDITYVAEPTPTAPYIDDVDYIGDFIRQTPYIGNPVGTAPYLDEVDYIGNFVGNVDYIGDFLGASSSTINVVVTFFYGNVSDYDTQSVYTTPSVTYSGSPNGGDTVSVTFANVLVSDIDHDGIIATSGNITNVSGSAAGSTNHQFKVNALTPSPYYVDYQQTFSGPKSGTYYARLTGPVDNDSSTANTTAPFVQTTPYVGNTQYTGDFILDINYTGDFIADFILDIVYEGDFIANFIADTLYEGDFILDVLYEGDFIADFILDIVYEGDYIGDFILETQYTGDFIADFILDILYEGDFIADFILDILYEGNTNPVIQFQDETNPVIQYEDNILYEGNFDNLVQYEGDFIADFILDILYEGDFIADFILDILYEGDFILDILYEGNTNPTINFVAEYQDETNPTINFVAEYQDETNPTTNPTIQFEGNTNPVIQFQDETNPTIQFQDETNPVIQFEDNIQYEGDFIGDFILDIIYETNFTQTGATAPFVGGETSSQVGTDVAVVETYTLYCKIDEGLDTGGGNVGFAVYDTGLSQFLSAPHNYAEDGYIEFRVATTAYSTVYLEIDHITTSNADFTTSVGSRIPITITGGVGFSGQIQFNEDSLTEGDETFYARLYDSSTGGTEIATNIFVTINDTSIAGSDLADAQITVTNFEVNQLGNPDFSGTSYQAGFSLQSDGDLVSLSVPDYARTDPLNASPNANWLPEAAKQVGIGSEYEVNITQVTGTITGTTVGYVTLGTTRNVRGRSSIANDNDIFLDTARVRIRKVGAGTDDVDVNITMQVNTQQ